MRATTTAQGLQGFPK